MFLIYLNLSFIPITVFIVNSLLLVLITVYNYMLLIYLNLSFIPITVFIVNSLLLVLITVFIINFCLSLSLQLLFYAVYYKSYSYHGLSLISLLTTDY